MNASAYFWPLLSSGIPVFCAYRRQQHREQHHEPILDPRLTDI